MSNVRTKVRCVDLTDDPSGQFDNYSRIHSRFNGAVVIFNGPTFRFPVHVVCVAESYWALEVCDPFDYPELEKFLGVNPTRAPYATILPNIGKWFSPFKSVGYVNTYKDGKYPPVVFMSRIPARTFSVGLTTSNTSIAELGQQQQSPSARFGRTLHRGIAKMVKNEYPSYREVMKGEEDTALSPNVAIELYDDDMGQWKVYFRQHLIGFVREDGGQTFFKGLPFVRKNVLYSAELIRLGLLKV